MDLRLDGKRALVTGSTAGIGYAIAEGLAQEGAEVIVNGRSAERVVEAVGAINHTTSTRAIGIAADLGSADGVTRLVNEVGRVDILVNNVGSSHLFPSPISPTRRGRRSSTSTS